MPAARKPERIRPLAHALARAADAERRARIDAAGRLGISASDFDALLLIASEDSVASGADGRRGANASEGSVASSGADGRRGANVSGGNVVNSGADGRRGASDAAGSLTAGRIAAAMAITTGAVTGLIDRLERAGWVQRTRHETDRRQVLIELAPARRSAVDAHRAAYERTILDAVGDIDDDELATAARTLDAIADRMTAELAERGGDGGDGEAPRDGGDGSDGDRAPLGELEFGRLVCSGAPRLALRAARIKDLYRATFRGRRPPIAVESDGTVTLKYKGFLWGGSRDAGAELTLTTAVPWTIEIRGGVTHLVADLRELHLAALELGGGVTESELSLPRPRGTATVRITGGASRLTIKRPRGTAAQVVVRGGASNLVFDAQRLGAVGSTTRLSTPGWDSAPDRWSIDLTGGASELSVIEL